jgi:hypothetical protein
MIHAVLASRDSPDLETRKGREHRMQTPPKNRTSALCSCGKVELEAEGDPIVSTVCYCESCQEGSRQIEALPDGRRVCGPDGGTAYVLYRKDRIGYPRGSELLRGLKLRDESSTRRVVAACCGSPMFLDFEKGHWLTVYRTALRGDLPPTEMRVHTKSRPEGVDLPDDVPNHQGYSLKFMAKLFGAWIPMLLRR